MSAKALCMDQAEKFGREIRVTVLLEHMIREIEYNDGRVC